MKTLVMMNKSPFRNFFILYIPERLKLYLDSV